MVELFLREREDDNEGRELETRSVSIFLDDACISSPLSFVLLVFFSHSRRRRLLCQTIPRGGLGSKNSPRSMILFNRTRPFITCFNLNFVT